VQSQITAVDFSADRIEKYELNNEMLQEFLEKPREDWVTCRWINGKEPAMWFRQSSRLIWLDLQSTDLAGMWFAF
jgi:hypothetical protein